MLEKEFEVAERELKYLRGYDGRKLNWFAWWSSGDVGC